MKREFDYLKRYYGNHTKAARALGVSQRSYRDYRNTGRMPDSIKHLIVDRVKLLEIQVRAA